jgi:hypothetical protein
MSAQLQERPASSIPGYTRGQPGSARSPLGDEEFALLKSTVLLGPDDLAALRMARAVLADQVEDVLDVWYGFVGGNPHLVKYFAGADGTPDARYLQAVRARFAAWILDTTEAQYDRSWLDYQYEIGRRHTRAGKNRTDGVASASPVVHLRYLIAFVVPLTATMKPFLAKKGHSAADVERMHAAWFKAVTLTAALWAQPYVADGQF